MKKFYFSVIFITLLFNLSCKREKIDSVITISGIIKNAPDALEKALLAAKQHCHGKLFCVFGCGGDRDVGKRSLMGEIAERLSDQVILTDDNVRSESPQDIIQDILCGCINPEQIFIEHDRKTAIKAAASQAKASKSASYGRAIMSMFGGGF